MSFLWSSFITYFCSIHPYLVSSYYIITDIKPIYVHTFTCFMSSFLWNLFLIYINNRMSITIDTRKRGLWCKVRDKAVHNMKTHALIDSISPSQHINDWRPTHTYKLHDVVNCGRNTVLPSTTNLSNHSEILISPTSHSSSQSKSFGTSSKSSSQSHNTHISHNTATTTYGKNSPTDVLNNGEYYQCVSPTARDIISPLNTSYMRHVIVSYLRSFYFPYIIQEAGVLSKSQIVNTMLTSIVMNSLCSILICFVLMPQKVCIKCCHDIMSNSFYVVSNIL